MSSDLEAQLPPSDIAAEQAVLGLSLRAPAHLTAAREILNGGQEFYRPSHEVLWALLCREQDAGHPTDPVSMLSVLQADREAVRALGGNLAYLHDLYATVAAGDPGYYARKVVDHHRRRLWIERGHRIAQLAQTAEPEELDLLALDQLEQAVQNLERRTTGSSWAAQDLTAALAGHELDPPPEWLQRTDGHALLYAAAVHTLAGEPETAKTWVALHGAVQAMQGGHQAALIDFEDRASRVVSRLLALGARPEWLAGAGARFHYVRPTDPLDVKTWPDLDAAVAGCSVVVIDGVTEAMTMHGLDLMSNPDAAKFYGMLPRRITDATGAAVVMIDHVVKDSDTRGRWAIGGQHKLAGIDGAAYGVKLLQPFGRGAHGIARITISKDRPGHVRGNALGLVAADFHLDATDPHATRAWLEKPATMPKDAHGAARPTILMQRVADYVQTHPGCTRDRIEIAVKGKATYVRQAIAQLEAEGYLEVTTGPRGAHIHHMIELFSDDAEPGQEATA